MNYQHWIIYLSVVAAVIVTPGPSAALCMTHGSAQGQYRTIATVLGGMLASMTLMTLSCLGLGDVITASNTLFQLIKFAGAIYLVFLGVMIWRTAPPDISTGSDKKSVSAPATSLRALFRQGFVVGIANPKDLLFFGALFPQFMDPSMALAPQVAVLAATWLFVDGSAMFIFALIGAKIGPNLARFGGNKMFNRLTGGAFVVAGGALAAAHE